MSKPILCLDFDGVISDYTSGWQGADVINDPPVPGAIAFMREAVKHFTVAVYSSRSGQPGGIPAMAQWLGHWVAHERLGDHEDLAWASAIQWPTEKPPAFLTIDDRALTFCGEWPDPVSMLTFKPWNKCDNDVETASSIAIMANMARCLALACLPDNPPLLPFRTHTRSGKPVRILAIDSAHDVDRPIIGLVTEPEGHESIGEWYPDGRWWRVPIDMTPDIRAAAAANELVDVPTMPTKASTT